MIIYLFLSEEMMIYQPLPKKSDYGEENTEESHFAINQLKLKKRKILVIKYKFFFKLIF